MPRARADPPPAPARKQLLLLCYPAGVEIWEVFQSLGRPALDELVRHISLGTLKAYKLYEPFKIRAHLTKLNTEHLRKSTGRFWDRLSSGDEGLAKDLAQAILVSNIGFIVEVLNFLNIPHDGNGFLPKDFSGEKYLTEGWQQRVENEFRGRYPDSLLRLYINHLMWEVDKQAKIYAS